MKILIVLLALTVSMTIQIQRKTENKKLRKNKNQNKIKINPNFKVNIYVDEKKYWKATFKTDDILKGAQDQEKKRGWYFDMQNKVDGDLALIMQKGQLGYFIPYRNILLDVGWVNPIGQGKWIEFTFSLTPAKSFKVQVQFEYQLIGAVVDNDDLRLLTSNLNKLKANRQSEIKNMKSEVLNQAAKFLQNQGDAEAASKGIQGINAKIAENTEKQNKLNEMMVSYNNTFNSIEKEVSVLEGELSVLKNEQNKIISEMNANTNMVSQTEASIKALEESKKSKTADTSQFEEKANGHKTVFNSILDQLLKEAPLSKDNIEEARSSLFEKNNLEGVRTSLAKIFP